MPYGSIRLASEWHPAHRFGMLSANTLAVGSDTFLTSCAPWQSVHTATRTSSASSRRWPCTLDQYLAYWSVGRPETPISWTLAWQLPHRATDARRSGAAE